MEKIKAWFRHSVTIVWSRLVAFSRPVIAALGTLADLFERPGIKDSIQVLLDPKHVPYYVIAFALPSSPADAFSIRVADDVAVARKLSWWSAPQMA